MRKGGGGGGGHGGGHGGGNGGGNGGGGGSGPALQETMNSIVEESAVEILQDASAEQGTHLANGIEMITLPIKESSAVKSKVQKDTKWSKVRNSVRSSNAFKAGGKNRTKRLSQIMKARRNSTTSENVHKKKSSNITILVDKDSGDK